MDGIQNVRKNSLRTKLSLWLAMAIMGVALVAGVVAFWSAFNEAHELQDDVLREIGSLFDRQHLPVPLAEGAGVQGSREPESRVFVQLLPTLSSIADGKHASPTLAFPPNLADGLHTVTIRKVRYRVLVKTLGSGKRLAVAQETEVRDEIARHSALRTLMPFLILVPILLLVVAHLVRKIFQTVADLSISIDRRGEQDLHPIAAGPLPTEIRPFIEAINRLFARVQQSMEAQRRFVADAAHELRSPLTALSLQAERLADAEMSSTAQERLSVLRRGIDRGRSLLDQLLALARAEVAPVPPVNAVSVLQVYRRVLEDLIPLADKKGIDVGVVSNLDARVLVNEVDLIAIVKNLVDNAIRYTPPGGRVDLSVFVVNGATSLVVEDSGPGIPEAERERVFDPFHRILGSDEIGSGLGLSIVRTIVDRVGADVSLDTSSFAESGLRVTVTFLP